MNRTEMEKELTEWNNDFDKAFRIVESLVESTREMADKEDLRKVVDRYEAVQKNARRAHIAIKEMLSSANPIDEDPETVLRGRIEELEEEGVGEELDLTQRYTALRAAMNTSANESQDLILEEIRYSRKDPFSKKDIVNPVRNKICKHVYDRDTLKQMIAYHKKNRTLCQCPIRSCPNKKKLGMADMDPYPEFFDSVTD